MSVQGQSTSGHKSLDQIKHPVFLSHSGKQKPFVWDLFKEFQDHARFLVEPPFFDQERASLPKGKEFPGRIIKAAKTCDVAVVILTKEYLTSKWPMLELTTFIDALKTSKSDMYLIPVFFDGLSPADLSDQVIEHRWISEWKKLTGSSSASWVDIFGFLSSCSRLAARCYSWLIGPRSRPSSVPSTNPLPSVHNKILLKVDKCKEALQMLRKRNGLPEEKYKSHGLLRKAIVEDALEALPPLILPVDTDNMQGRDRLCQVISRMFKERDGIHCLGLYGIGGSGKTTLCTALCRYFGPDFNDKVYHLEIGSNDNGKEKLTERHKELLRKLIGLSEEDVNKIRDPSSDLRLHLRKQPVFLAVDNVQQDSCEEAQDYLKYLCQGSKIIFTARSRIVENVLESPIYCEPIPNLERPEAMSLILKIAAPRRKRDTLDKDETRILYKCLLICLFPQNERANIGTGPDFMFPLEFMTLENEVKSMLDTREIGGHYHPLALQAVASYFKHLKQNRISDWEPELDKYRHMLFHSYHSKTRIFDVLEIGFNGIEKRTKQIFIDVALYAPSPTDAEDIYDWLVAIRAPLEPKIIELDLRTLRTLSFLNYEDGSPEQTAPTCMNIRMHELYREYAKRYVNNDDSYPYGVYYDPCETQPVLTSSSWAKVPRIHLQRWGCPIKVSDWCRVSVIHLQQCDTLTTFSMGPELINLRCLTIFHCSQLVSLSWTKKHKRSMMRLTFVDLALNDNLETLPDFSTCPELRTVNIAFNKSLKTLPDFCTCPELRSVSITECSSSVDPLRLRDCSKLEFLIFRGKNVPEIYNLESCPKLKSAKLVWKASREGLLSNLPYLSKLTIEGPSSVPSYMADNVYDISHPVPAHKLFCKHHPQETICYELSGVWKQNNLRKLQLKYIPMGCLPLGLETGTVAPNLVHLNLEGCLLSRWVDFSFFPNLQHLSIMRTNVQKISGVRSLKKLVALDCRFCFRLRKIPNLRSLPALKYVILAQNPDLKAIPRLPQGCCEGKTEDSVRETLAVCAFASTAKSALPPPLFAIRTVFENPTKLMEYAGNMAALALASLFTRGEAFIHYGIECDGCKTSPLVGPRYRPKRILMEYDLCSKCYTNKCRTGDCNFTKSSRPRIKRLVEHSWNYDLCYVCFMKSGCDESEFLKLDETRR